MLKLRLIRVLAALATLAAFGVASGAGTKFG
jgi:hypothetical protein